MHFDTIKVIYTLSKSVSSLPKTKSFENYLKHSCLWWVSYVIVIMIISFLLRLLFSAMRANEERVKDITTEGKSPQLIMLERTYKAKPFNERWKIILHGYCMQDPTPDFWYNSLIGTFELLAFPFILNAEQYSIIGAWLAYKVVANWNVWNKNRLKFNSFLIGNLFVIAISYFIKQIIF